MVQSYGRDRSRLVCIGKKGSVFFRRRGYDVVADLSLPSKGMTFQDAQALSKRARELFENGEIDELFLVYTQFVSAISQKPQVSRILPIQKIEQDENLPESASSDYIFEPDAEQILASLLPRYVDTQVFQAVVESVASEFGAKMTSMTSATENAGKMISGLTLSLNRARQATITKEISEIVGGAEALK
jgi:F-type H+-transporting ATPase subunit gamma